MRRALAFGLMAVLTVTTTTVSAPLPAAAASFDPNSMVFPVDGDYRMHDNFGACRDGCARKHEGVDIMAAKMVPVVAVADGVVSWISSTNPNCGICLNIKHDDQWSTSYVHLNNDTPGTDDGKGWGIAPGIERGTPVKRGQLIGWVGDSGNAENAGSHLHFELQRNGVAIDAYPYLLRAAETWNGTFRDDDSSIHEEDIEAIYARDITRGCNPPTNDRYCPQADITRGEIAAFLVRTLGLAQGTTTGFSDMDGHLFEGDVAALMEAGIGFGCSETAYCPDRPLLRDEMAEMLVRAFDFGDENPGGEDFFVDDNGNRFEESINKIGANGVTKGCNPPDNDRFCPERSLTRAEMASFMVRALNAAGD